MSLKNAHVQSIAHKLNNLFNQRIVVTQFGDDKILNQELLTNKIPIQKTAKKFTKNRVVTNAKNQLLNRFDCLTTGGVNHRISADFLLKNVRCYCAAAKDNKNKMANLAPTVVLNNGMKMPVLGLGTYEEYHNVISILRKLLFLQTHIKNFDYEKLKKAICMDAVKNAIDLGYRHIDTAYLYKNEKYVGEAINEKINSGCVKREDLFLVSKLWNTFHEPVRVKHACQMSLDALWVKYIDLYLMHSPVGFKYVNDDALMPHKDDVLQTNDIDYLDTYKAMEELVKCGLVRSIGLSNFNSKQIQRILENCTIKPVTNQIECHPGLNQKRLIEFCRARDIVVTAYSPLARPKPSKELPNFYTSDKVAAIAKKYNKTTAQIILRYLLDIGVVVIPKSKCRERLQENMSVFDFKLTPEEIRLMEEFNTGKRLWGFDIAKDHKFFPYNIDF